MIVQRLERNWKMRAVGEDEVQSAIVPGSVYTDLLRNGKMEDPFWKDNEDRALLLMEKEYEYIEHFQCDQKMLDCERVFLHFYGLDTLADISFNGNFLGSVDNMHREWEYDVTDMIKKQDNELIVLFHSPTKFIREAFQKAPTRGAEDAMQGFVHLRKAHCMFGWDWGAHLPDAGIYRPIELRGVDKGRIDSVYITQNHQEGKVELELQVVCDWFGTPTTLTDYTVKITDPHKNTMLYDGSPQKIQIENPKLWWPNGYGRQDMYQVSVSLCMNGTVLDTWEKSIGLRTMTVNTEQDTWGEKFAITVNGVSIFSMGADYIPEDHLLGRVTKETTRTLLEKAKFAHFNTIRVWGGGYYPEDWFYDLCDELGFVVWQDFMFACGVYDLTQAFEENIRAEFIDNIKRLRHHASLGLWCGNNEIESFVSRKQWVSKASEIRDYILLFERIIPEILKKYDPQTFYWPSSPSSGGTFDKTDDPNMGDIHYWDVWHQDKPFTEYRKFFFRYLSEFGFQSFPSERTIDQITDDPADKNIFSYIMEKHQRNGAANGKIINYMQQTYKYPTNFDTVIYASQLLQADAIKYGVEHFRRNRGRCMGAVYWQFNDCWPVASWSSIDYTGRLKALHYFARRFYAPIMISCHEEGMMSAAQPLNWLPFAFEKSIHLNVANESMNESSGVVRWQIRNADATVVKEECTALAIPALDSVWLEKELLPEIDIYNQYVSFSYEVEDKIVSEGSVLFSYPKYFHFVDPQLTYRVEGDTIVVCAKAYAKSVEIRNEEDNFILEDNFFDMNAGEKRIKILSGATNGIRLRSIYDIH